MCKFEIFKIQESQTFKKYLNNDYALTILELSGFKVKYDKDLKYYFFDKSINLVHLNLIKDELNLIKDNLGNK